jgi:NADH-quinone oxidoreductase subunit N
LDLIALTPVWVIAVFALAIILCSLFIKNKQDLGALGIIGLLISIGISLTFITDKNSGVPLASFGNMLAVDNFSLFFQVLFAGMAILVILATSGYADKLGSNIGEYYALILLSTVGMMLMASTAELISAYVALELTSMSLYVMVGLLKDEKSTESALKYLLLGAVSSAVLLYGMAMVFGFTGATQFGDIAKALQAMSLTGVLDNPALLLGIVMMIAGFGFKMAAVPFQMWVPDVYEGAPTPVTAFLSVASKAAGFALVMRVFLTAFSGPVWLSHEWGIIFAVLAIAGMIIGNVAAIPQQNIKRLFGYSSIAQAGYLMVGLAAMGISAAANTSGQSGVIFFLTSYAVTNLGAFIAIIAITNKINSDNIADFSGMGKRSPVLALALTLCLISLIGMPPASGFMAKFFIFNGAVQNGLLWLVIIAVINSVISAYYYLRIVKVMWLGEPASAEKIPSSGMLRVGLLLACIGVLLLGILPGVFMHASQTAAGMLTF